MSLSAQKMTIVAKDSKAMLRMKGLMSDEAYILGCSPSACVIDAVNRLHVRSDLAAQLADMMYLEGATVPQLLSLVFSRFAEGSLKRTRGRGVLDMALRFSYDVLWHVGTSAPEADRARQRWDSVVARLAATAQGAEYESALARELDPKLGSVVVSNYVDAVIRRLDDLAASPAAWEFLSELFGLVVPECRRDGGISYCSIKRPEGPKDRLRLLDEVSALTGTPVGMALGREAHDAPCVPTVSFTVADGRKLRFSSAWIVLNPLDAPRAVSAVVVETRNGGSFITDDGQGVPHFVLFLTDKRLGDITNEEIEQLYLDICQYWPSFAEVLEHRSQNYGLDGRPCPAVFNLMDENGIVVGDSAGETLTGYECPDSDGYDVM